VSAKLVGWALEQDGLELQEKFLLVVLADHFNDQEGAAWPSQERIARIMNVSDRQVRRIQVELINKGFLEVTKRHGQSNIYKMVVPDIDVLVPRTHASYTPDTAVLHNSYRTLKERYVGQEKKTKIPDKYKPEPIPKDVLQGEQLSNVITNIKKNLRKAQ
jgi:hypothetical protein